LGLPEKFFEHIFQEKKMVVDDLSKEDIGIDKYLWLVVEKQVDQLTKYLHDS